MLSKEEGSGLGFSIAGGIDLEQKAITVCTVCRFFAHQTEFASTTPCTYYFAGEIKLYSFIWGYIIVAVKYVPCLCSHVELVPRTDGHPTNRSDCTHSAVSSKPPFWSNLISKSVRVHLDGI